MLDYPWPGNVREPKRAPERACVLSVRGKLPPESMFDEMPAKLAPADQTLAEYLAAYKRQYITRVLAAHDGHGRHGKMHGMQGMHDMMQMMSRCHGMMGSQTAGMA